MPPDKATAVETDVTKVAPGVFVADEPHIVGWDDDLPALSVVMRSNRPPYALQRMLNDDPDCWPNVLGLGEVGILMGGKGTGRVSTLIAIAQAFSRVGQAATLVVPPKVNAGPYCKSVLAFPQISVHCPHAETPLADVISCGNSSVVLLNRCGEPITREACRELAEYAGTGGIRIWAAFDLPEPPKDAEDFVWDFFLPRRVAVGIRLYSMFECVKPGAP